MDSVTLKITSDVLNKMEEFYHEIISYENLGDYILWKCKTINDVVITIYSSKKGIKALFTGPNCLNEAKIWNQDALLNEKKEKINAYWLYLKNQIGSDEVGTGDFFGPVIVVASFIKEEDIEFLKSLGVDDSKKLDDSKILEIVPLLLKRVAFSKLTCTNQKYNQLVSKGYTMNSIKALLHNKALLNVTKKIKQTDVEYFVDQFCDVDLYYKYIQYEDEIINHHITFKTKGESFYPSVAVSSMIARYCFLKEMELIEQKYQTKIPKGASTKVDECAKIILEKYGLDELRKIVKVNFVNYKNLL